MQVFQAPVPVQTAGDCFLVRLDSAIHELRQRLGITFAIDDRPQDSHPCHARNITDDAGQLDVHLAERFLKAVQGLSLIAHFSGSLSNQGTNRTYGISRTKSTAQQTVTHQLPNPLAIENI
ncbi:hypothetical protein D3C73_898970 [compost metagenome]